MMSLNSTCSGHCTPSWTETMRLGTVPSLTLSGKNETVRLGTVRLGTVPSLTLSSKKSPNYVPFRQTERDVIVFLGIYKIIF